jgi:hypothetical protein
MKFNILGREVNVEWDHVFIAVGSMLLWIFLTGIITLLILNLVEGSSDTNNETMVVISWFFGIFILPILAFTMLYVAEFFNHKKDVQLCRSLAGAEFILILIVFIILAAYSLIKVTGYLSDLALVGSYVVGQIGVLSSFVFSSIMLYLWLLFFLNLNIEKIKKVAILSLVFVIAINLGNEILSPLMEFLSNNVYSLKFTNAFYAAILKEFLFGFIVLYHLQGRVLDRSLYLIVIIFIAPYIAALISTFLDQYASSTVVVGVSSMIQEIITLVQKAISVVILYLLKDIKLR